MLRERVLDKEILNEKVSVSVVFGTGRGNTTVPEYYEGVITSMGNFCDEHFIVLDDEVMINMKYVQTIEFIK